MKIADEISMMVCKIYIHFWSNSWFTLWFIKRKRIPWKIGYMKNGLNERNDFSMWKILLKSLCLSLVLLWEGETWQMFLLKKTLLPTL